MAGTDDRAGRERRVSHTRKVVIIIRRRLKLLKADIRAKRRERHVVVGGDVGSSCRVAGVVTAWFGRFAFCDQVEQRVFDVAVPPRVADEGRSKTANANAFVRPQEFLDQKALDVKKTHVFETITEKDKASR